MPAYYAEDVETAKKQNKTAVIFGFQNPAPIEDDIGLVEILHRLGGRFMQLSYNNQSLLATGCYENNDPGITRMGKEVIKEMNRVGMVVDMSHSSERSTFEAIELSQRPIVISHANPSFWHPAKRNKSNDILIKLAENKGLLGFSLYPHHLNNSSDCLIQDFCTMIAKTVELMGIDHVGFGSDLCQDQPDSIVEWMRVGKWTKEIDYGEGSASNPGFPDMPTWFRDNRDWDNILSGLKDVGFNDQEINKIKGQNWLNFFKKSFTSIK
jgi:microsomal dipeptidase-like Zn-dependent dipeptidase